MKKNWTKDEVIAAFYLYCLTPFGKIHRRNPEIICLADRLKRSPDSLAMKMCNFASFDPIHQQRKIKGLSNSAKIDRIVWDEYYNHWDKLLDSYRDVQTRFKLSEVKEDTLDEFLELPQETETTTTVRIRLAQGFFRRSVLSNYNYQCAICRITHRELLNASHIVPWSVDEAKRANPQNGISLCALHDRAFDRGFITFDGKFQIILSETVRKSTKSDIYKAAFHDFEGKAIHLPDKFAPLLTCLEYHRTHIFLG
jgi:putative restriction endonuclease